MHEADSRVVVVVVAYGARRQSLLDVLDALRREAPARVVVVDNGCAWPIARELVQTHGDWIDVLPMGTNTGSAPAYAAGMRRAVELGAQWIWLLDDDNQPGAGSLALLRDAHARLFDPARPLLAVAALRPQGHQGLAPQHWSPRHSAFCGFHFLDIPRKLGKRLGLVRPHALPTTPIPIGVCAYGGLFFAAGLLDAIGAPKGDLVLYCDDYEWTSRITAAGGRIFVVPRAVVHDLGFTWGSARGNHIRSLLEGSHDSLAYYAIRNEAYFFGQRWRRSRWQYLLNSILFRALVWALSWQRGRRKRYAILVRGLRDGHAGHLGTRPEYPL